MRVGLAAALVVGACGAPNSQGMVDSSTPDVDGTTQGSDAAGDAWRILVDRTWDLPMTTEDYFCRRIKITEDTYIVGFRAEAPTGTHHAVVTMTPDATDVGDYHCDDTATPGDMLFAGGIGMDELTFPAGVAMKVPAGWYVNLNLHVDNRGSTTMTGKSGVYIKTVPAAMVQHEADMVFIGTNSALKTIPANTTKTLTGECQLPSDWHLVGLVPHMHDIAVQQTVKDLNQNLTPAATLLDTAYTVAQQHSYPMDVVVPLNHYLTVDCHYVNGTNREYGLAESAYSEQCLAGMYRWPKQTGNYAGKYFCAQ